MNELHRGLTSWRQVVTYYDTVIAIKSNLHFVIGRPIARKRLKPNSIALAGSKLDADKFEAGRRPASNQLRTSYSVMEFGREPASSC